MTTRELAELIDEWMRAWDGLPATRPGIAFFVAKRLIEDGIVGGTQ